MTTPARQTRTSVKSLEVISSGPDPTFIYPASYAETEPFTKPHTVTVLLLGVAFIVYGVWIRSEAEDADNVKMGIFGALAVGLIFCAEHLRDTLFIRPHPAIWRFVTGVGLFYSLFLTYLFFQRIDSVRALMPHLDPTVTGKALEHRNYAENCELTWKNLEDTLMDEFVIAHLVGWIFKHLMIRDVGISMTLSLLFELMEYTFEFIQPNFKECWWDHWILDFLLCNTGGIIIGEILLHYLQSKNYNWSGFGQFHSWKGRAWRAIQQFTPYNFTSYEWYMLKDFKRFCYVTVLCVGIMVVEVDAFLLKDIFWLQPRSKINVTRLVIWWAVGMVGLRDFYAFVSNPRIKRMGATAWVMLAMLLMEFFVVLKFYKHLASIGTIPPVVIYAWSTAAVLFAAFVVMNFTPLKEDARKWFPAVGGGSSVAHQQSPAPSIVPLSATSPVPMTAAQHHDSPHAPPARGASSARRRMSTAKAERK